VSLVLMSTSRPSSFSMCPSRSCCPYFPFAPVQMPSSAPLASHPCHALLSNSERTTSSPYSPYLALPFQCTRGCLLSSDCVRSPPLSPAPGGSHLHACPLPSLHFISWLTSSSFSRCCRSCPRLSTTIVGAHRWQEAAAPPSSTTSPTPCAVGELPCYPPCLAARTYYHGARHEDVMSIWSLVSRCKPRRPW
jgi:hypothetical protein